MASGSPGVKARTGRGGGFGLPYSACFDAYGKHPPKLPDEGDAGVRHPGPGPLGAVLDPLALCPDQDLLGRRAPPPYRQGTLLVTGGFHEESPFLATPAVS
jgi:hypothetical protein